MSQRTAVKATSGADAVSIKMLGNLIGGHTVHSKKKGRSLMLGRVDLNAFDRREPVEGENE